VLDQLLLGRFVALLGVLPLPLMARPVVVLGAQVVDELEVARPFGRQLVQSAGCRIGGDQPGVGLLGFGGSAGLLDAEPADQERQRQALADERREVTANVRRSRGCAREVGRGRAPRRERRHASRPTTRARRGGCRRLRVARGSSR
jgi:hypothetical protein